MGHDLDRYHRQMLLPGFGSEGQKKLLSATVLVVGCGALGTVVANTLARAGVGHLIIVDRDYIEISNLQRQVLFDEHDVEKGIPKAEAARLKLSRINSQVKVTSIVDDLNHTNIETLVTPPLSNTASASHIDAIVDGVDNFETRFLVNDCAVKHGIPYVYGGAVGTVGMTYAILPHSAATASSPPWEQAGKATPCLRCIFEQMPQPGMSPTCDTVGVLNAVASIVASMEAAEVLKILTGNWHAINPMMQHLDVWENSFHQFHVEGAYDVSRCICCKQRRFEFLEGRFASGTTTLCGRNAIQLTQRCLGSRLDFDQIVQRLRPHGTVKVNRFMLCAHITDHGKPYELTIFTDGRAIVKGTKEPNVAKSIYAKYIGT